MPCPWFPEVARWAARTSGGRPRHPPRAQQRVDFLPLGPAERASEVPSLLDDRRLPPARGDDGGGAGEAGGGGAGAARAGRPAPERGHPALPPRLAHGRAVPDGAAVRGLSAAGDDVRAARLLDCSGSGRAAPTRRDPGRPRPLHRARRARQRMAGGLREAAGSAAPRRVRGDRAPRLRRRRDARGDSRPSRLGRGLASE